MNNLASGRLVSRTERLRNQALAMMNHGDAGMCETPREPTAAEACYLEARDLFEAKRICAGCDKLDEGDALSGLR